MAFREFDQAVGRNRQREIDFEQPHPDEGPEREKIKAGYGSDLAHGGATLPLQQGDDCGLEGFCAREVSAGFKHYPVVLLSLAPMPPRAVIFSCEVAGRRAAPPNR